MTISDLKKELNDVRFYYLHKSEFDKQSSEVGESSVVQLVKKFNQAITNAPAKLYMLFVEIYVNNKTYEDIAYTWCYSTVTIFRLVQNLMKYFVDYFDVIDSALTDTGKGGSANVGMF